MKRSYLVIFWLAINSTNGYSQDSTLHRIESPFETVTHSTAFPCTWNLQRIVKNNGAFFPSGLPSFNEHPFFVRDDSTKYEIEFFKTPSLPFYNPKETNLETSEAFYKWEVNQLKNQKEFSITKLIEGAEDTFIIVKIKGNTNEFYRLLVTSSNITYSIKLYAKGRSVENQLDELKLLCTLNTKY